MDELRLDTNVADYLILVIYFVAVLGIGFAARRYIKTSLDYFLSGRSLPAWITGLAFISANLGALEILGMAANGAQFGVATVHYYWIGAVPAMVFLGLVMMPFYYGSRVRSVPEYLRLRFNRPTHLFNALTFAFATVLIAGVNLYALALVLKLLLGWPIIVGIVVAAAIVLVYITLGGLSSAIYNEVLQFFVILAALVPLTLVGLHDVGGWDGLKDAVTNAKGGGDPLLHSWKGTGVGNVTNPLEASWIPIVFGLGFVLSFGYWTTNFAEVQRALSAKSLNAAQRTPLIGAYPKIFIPAITIIPGLVALVTIKGLGGDNPDLEYNNAIPLLINEYLPNGMLGVALAGCSPPSWRGWRPTCRPSTPS
jgi:SSS family solute:Na+ symporter